MTKRIALIGSAPSSVQLAPYHDPSWNIWGCSPGARPFVKRADAWWEIHRREPGKPWFQPEYIAFMAQLKCPVYVIEPWPELPTAVVLDTDEILEKFGPYYFKSSLSWMVAKAAMDGAAEIGLWGVDMAAADEWQFQRTSLQCLLWRLQEPDFGINIALPPESDLWMPGGMYGLQEIDPHHIKLLRRKEELSTRLNEAKHILSVKQREVDFLQGAFDDNEYHINTWVCHPTARSLATRGPLKLASLNPDAGKLPPIAVADAATGKPIGDATADLVPPTVSLPLALVEGISRGEIDHHGNPLPQPKKRKRKGNGADAEAVG